MATVFCCCKGHDGKGEKGLGVEQCGKLIGATHCTVTAMTLVYSALVIVLRYL